MAAFLFYLIKSGLCLVLLYLSFRFLMSRTTFFRLNRLILVAGMLCCALLPLVELTTEKQFLYNPLQSVRYLLDDVLFTHPLLPSSDELSTDGVGGTFTLRSVVVEEANGNQLLPWIISGIYLLGGAGVFLWIAASTFRMWRFIRGSEKRIVGKYRLIVTPQSVCSFSWGRYIVLSEVDYTQHADEIVQHEMMHLRHHHTFDLLFLQLFLVLHWFNPVIWLLKRELQEIHEYEADNGVINTGIDATRYQLLLVKKAVGTRLYSMANGFNHSKLKNRITMMLKERTNRWARLKLLLFVPVVAGTLYAFAQPEVKEVKSAYEQIRTDLSANSANKSKGHSDELFPIHLSEISPKEERINNIVITLHTSEGIEKIENFTLDELEKKVVEARAKMLNPDEFVVGVKADKDCKMGIVTDVKEVLRKAYALKLNFSIGKEKSTK